MCNDKFQGMYISVQSLYVQLNMKADDDAFIVKVPELKGKFTYD